MNKKKRETRSTQLEGVSDTVVRSKTITQFTELSITDIRYRLSAHLLS